MSTSCVLTLISSVRLWLRVSIFCYLTCFLKYMDFKMKKCSRRKSSYEFDIFLSVRCFIVGCYFKLVSKGKERYDKLI